MSDMLTNIFSHIQSILNGSVFPALIVVGGIIYFSWTFYRANKITNRHRKFVQQKLFDIDTTLFPKREYFIACAGSKQSEVGPKVSAIDIQQCNLCDNEGNPLNLSLYNCYVVHGDSMKYAGINNNDFILVPKDFKLDSLISFPEIVVLRYKKQNDDRPLYKVRRAWYTGSIEDNIEEAAKHIVEMSKFSKLTKQNGYKGTEWMIKDLLEKRLVDFQSVYFKDGKCPEQYKKIVISTTFDTEKKYIHFSIHPVSLIIGNVEQAYTV